MQVPIKWVQDILSGRIMSKRTGIKTITRKERQKYNPVNSKLTKEQVLEMVKLYYDELWEPMDISKKFNINVNRIYEILKRETWGEVTNIKRINQLPRSTTKRFTSKEILQIVKEFNEGISKKDLAEKYDTSKGYINAILTGRKWNNLTHIKK